MSCPDCFSGSVHEGTPRGRMAKICGLPTYVSEPGDRAAKAIIVIIPDAFGIDFVNNKILADHYAEKGDYLVYLPDFMAGRSAPIWMLNGFRVMESKGNYLSKLYYFPWMLSALVPWYWVNRIAASYPRVTNFFQELRVEEPNLPIGAAGFCWGGKHAVLLAGDETRVNAKPLIDAGFTGHPSLLTMPGDIEKMQRPMAFAIGDQDKLVPPETVKKIEEIVRAKPESQMGEVVSYPNCGHGFCVRADTTFVEVMEQSLLAEDQCIRWFNKCFSQNGQLA